MSQLSRYIRDLKTTVSKTMLPDRDHQTLKSSGLFDERYYRHTYPDFAAAQPDPIQHYLTIGAKKGYDPNPWFHTTWYLDNNRDVAALGLNPLLHYVRHGAAENRRPSTEFDAVCYRELTGRPADPRVLPLADFLACLAQAEADGTPPEDSPAGPYVKSLHENDLDPVFYAGYYHLGEMSETEIRAHFARIGKAENRYPNVGRAIAALENIHGPLPRDFDEKAYLDHYDSVAREYPYPGGGIVHYLQFGRAEGTPTVYGETYDAHRLHLMMNRIHDLPDVMVCAEEPVRINVLVPAFEFKSMSAGFFGVFQVARFISSCGFRVRLVMFDNFYYNEQEFREKLKGYPGMENLFDELEVLYIGERKAPLRISAFDNCVATVWYSAYFARKIMDKAGHRPFLYLIQDYETHFYAGSALYSAAERSYDFSYNALFSSETLRRAFVDGGIGTFGKKPPRHIAFNNACARFLPSKAAFVLRPVETYKLAFYCRPQVQRNMFELGALALCEAYARGIFDGGKAWEFYGIGLGEVTINIAEGVSLKQMKRMNLSDYQKAIGDFDLGVCLMASPHPSLLPFDLGGSGALVVTNNFGTKDQAYFDGLCKNVISCDPDLDAVVDGIEAAVVRLKGREKRYDNARAMTFPDDWAKTFDAGHVAFVRETFKGSLAAVGAENRTVKAPAARKKPPVVRDLDDDDDTLMTGT